jgi:histidine kinase/DNA gyrase B/HSP90-like ATPase
VGTAPPHAQRLCVGGSCAIGLDTRATKPHVDIRSVLSILGDLYPNRAFALVRENLQNSIDAGADTITVDFNPSRREATFADNGSGVSPNHLNEDGYFSLQWTTKKGKDKIGSKGIGRWTNLGAAKRVIVESRSDGSDEVFTWHSNGSFSRRRSAPTRLSHPGLLLTLSQIDPHVASDLAAKVEEVATTVFDQYLRDRVEVRFNGQLIRPKEYRGKRHQIKLKSGGRLELYWDRGGQEPDDQGVALKCRGVRVGVLDRFGIESEEWTNIAGILHLDQLDLIANRDAFADTPTYRAAKEEAKNQVRTFIARMEGSRRFRRDRMEDAYTKAAQDAARKLGLDLSILGGPVPRREPSEDHSESNGEPILERTQSSHRGEGERPGFRLKPTDFGKDSALADHRNDMSWRQGSVILVNLGHPACPENKYALSLYIWCCGLVEILRWGVLEGGKQLDRAELLTLYTGWLAMWPRDLARVTAGSN